jgi:putative hydrolase of the HAD superfamily
MSDLCVVFDMDDTLYLERDYARSGFRALGEWARDWLSIENFEDACLAQFESGCRSTIFNAALAACGIEATPEVISCLVEFYRAHVPGIALLADAATALEQLRSTYPIAIVTDGPLASQSRKVEALGLTSVASPVVLTGIFGKPFSKPHTRAFLHVAERVPVRRYVYIADNPAKDFAGPRELGWATIRMRRSAGLHYHVENERAEPPDLELGDCSRLPAILRDLAHQSARAGERSANIHRGHTL